MPIRVKKLSEYPKTESWKDLVLMGKDEHNDTVQVEVEFIKKGYDETVKATDEAKTATKNANDATTKANTAADRADKSADNADTATARANKAAEGVEAATKKANDAGDYANKQGDRAKEYTDNPNKMGDNGNWWKWDEEKKAYVDTGILAKGGVLYPTFEVVQDDDALNTYMDYQDEIASDMFQMEEGDFYFNDNYGL